MLGVGVCYNPRTDVCNRSCKVERCVGLRDNRDEYAMNGTHVYYQHGAGPCAATRLHACCMLNLVAC